MKKELTAIEIAFKKAVESKTKKKKADVMSALALNKQVNKPVIRVTDDNLTKNKCVDKEIEVGDAVPAL